MATTTTDEQRKLNAINEILASVGQAPVNTLEETNPDVAIIQNTFDRVTREVQSEGWSFNKWYKYKLTREASGTYKDHIIWPTDALQVDLIQEDYPDKHSVWRRKDNKRFLFDVYKDAEDDKNGFEWTDDVYVEVTWELEWKDLPTVIQDYITARSAAVVSSRIVGDAGQYQMAQQKEVYCRAMALEYECNQGDYTYFGNARGQKNYNSYKPYTALQR